MEKIQDLGNCSLWCTASFANPGGAKKCNGKCIDTNCIICGFLQLKLDN